MRRPLLPSAITVALIAAFFTVTSGTSASAATWDGGSTTGVFYIKPSPFNDGDKVTLSANFPSDQKSTKVTFYKTVGDPDGNAFEEVGVVKKANSSGNAYLKNYLLDGNQILFARTSKDKKTQRFVVDSGAEPGTCPIAGTLTSTPAIVTPGSMASAFANFLTDQSGSVITFYKVTGDTEVSLGTEVADSFGNATFDVQVDDPELKIRAQTANSKCTKTLTITPKVIDPANFPNQQGTLTVSPGDVRVGEKGKLTANFSSSLKGLSVTFFRKVSGSPDTWEGVDSATTNSSGDAFLPDYTFNGPETFFGLTDTEVRTPVVTITPKQITDVDPGGPTTLGKNVLYVETNDRKIPTKKGVDEPGAAAWSKDGALSDTFDLETFAVRGNTTANLAKKPFKLKFASKQSPFGIKKDKTWVLLANYNDRSFVRTFSAFDLASKLSAIAWTSKGVYTELYVNGSYRGSYQLIQSIKIDKDRVNVNKETGQIIEFDPWWVRDGVPGMEGTGIYKALDYSWKDPDEYSADPEDLNSKKVSDMKKKIRNFEDVLYGSTKTKDWSKVKTSTLAAKDDWTTYLDMDSAVDYYLVKEFTKDTDADMYRSNYFHTDNVDPNNAAKFVMGPVWDFDRSAGARKSSTMPDLDDTDGWRLRGTSYHNTGKIHWYTRIVKDPRFLKALYDRWAAKKGEFLAMSGGSRTGNGSDTVTKGLSALGGGDAALGQQVFNNDQKVWGTKKDRLKPRTSSYPLELEWLRNWYLERYQWMNSQLTKTPPPIK